MQEILRALGSIETKLDMLIVSTDKTSVDHEGRIRGLEKRERWLAGAGATLTGMWVYLMGK